MKEMEREPVKDGPLNRREGAGGRRTTHERGAALQLRNPASCPLLQSFGARPSRPQYAHHAKARQQILRRALWRQSMVPVHLRK